MTRCQNASRMKSKSNGVSRNADMVRARVTVYASGTASANAKPMTAAPVRRTSAAVAAKGEAK